MLLSTLPSWHITNTINDEQVSDALTVTTQKIRNTKRSIV